LAVRLQNAREEWTDRRTPFEWLFDKLSFTAELKMVVTHRNISMFVVMSWDLLAKEGKQAFMHYLACDVTHIIGLS
jgi:hypothetical protein